MDRRFASPLDRDRARSLAGVAVLHLCLGWALVAGLGIEVPFAAEERLKLFDVAAPAPPPPTETAQSERATPEPEGEAAPPNLRARPVPVVAPRPEIPIERPPPITAAPVAAEGPDTDAGAAEIPGPGTGAGGAGDGLGSGGAGSGTGGGGGIASRPSWRSGRITERDLPGAAWRGRARGSVTVRLAVEANGRVSGCSVARSSGDPELDALTCRLIRERFRYEPARDRRGRAVRGTAGWRQDWWQGRG